MDQIFGIVPSVKSLVLYLLDDPLLVGSFEFSSQPLFEEELVAHYTRIWRYTHSHGKGGEILKMVYEMRWNQITLRGGQCNTYRFIILHKSFKLAQVAFIMRVVVVLATISNVMVPTFEQTTGLWVVCVLSAPHTSTTLCNSSVCVSMLCFETVLACITALLTNCGPFNRRSSTCKLKGDHGVNDSRVSKS